MYKHVSLNSRGALPSQNLENLGHVVVVCGKNNSGKSTLLSAIIEGNQYLYATEFDIDQFTACIRYNDGTQWSSANDLVRPVLYHRDIWFQHEHNTFLDILYDQYRKWQIMGNRPVDFGQNILSVFNQHLPSHRPVLIPPKRLLQLISPIQTDVEVQPDGQGLLNFLFRAANQFEDSVNRKIYDEIKQAFKIISDGYEFIITAEHNNSLKLSFRSGSDRWISASDCGLGLQDLLVLLFFVTSPDFDILLVEEPESHLHPAMQRKLLHFCKERKNKQFFFSTHSSVFLDLTLVDTILHTEMTDHGIEVSNDTSRAAVLDSLGYSVTDNLVSDLIILVEGPSDKPVLEEFLRQMGLYASYSIKVWPLGGDIMNQCDLSVFAEKYKIIALIDKDPGSASIRRKFKHNCELLSIEVQQLERRAIENYFTVDALRSVFEGQIPPSLTKINPDETLESQIGMNVKKKNQKIARAMTLQHIQDTDLYRFLQRVGDKLRH